MILKPLKVGVTIFRVLLNVISRVEIRMRTVSSHVFNQLINLPLLYNPLFIKFLVKTFKLLNMTTMFFLPTHFQIEQARPNLTRLVTKFPSCAITDTRDWALVLTGAGDTCRGSLSRQL